jgi:hypothetical protein
VSEHGVDLEILDRLAERVVRIDGHEVPIPRDAVIQFDDYTDDDCSRITITLHCRTVIVRGYP